MARQLTFTRIAGGLLVAGDASHENLVAQEELWRMTRVKAPVPASCGSKKGNSMPGLKPLLSHFES